MLRLRMGHTNAFCFSLLRRARHQSGTTHVAFRTSADAISPPVAMNNLVRFCMTLKSQFSADIPKMTQGLVRPVKDFEAILYAVCAENFKR
jgi:hypothetical protein